MITIIHTMAIGLCIGNVTQDHARQTHVYSELVSLTLSFNCTEKSA